MQPDERRVRRIEVVVAVVVMALFLAALGVAVWPTARRRGVRRGPYPTPPQAAPAYDAESVRRLLRRDPSLVQTRGPDLLVEAIEAQDVETVMALLDGGVDPTAYAQSKYGTEELPLCRAAATGDLQLVQLLLGHGADARATGPSGWTPLHAAAGSADCSPDVVECLVRAGADPNARDASGCTPLHCVPTASLGMRWGPRTAKDIADALIAGGADVNAQDHEGVTPLHLAIRWADTPELAAALVAKGANVNVPDACGWTPVHVAAASGNEERLKLLLDHGADVHAALSGDGESEWRVGDAALSATPYRGAPWSSSQGPPQGTTALHLAIACRAAECVELLLDAGANVNAASEEGWTPLHEAAARGSLEVVQALLDAGADPNAATKGGSSVLHAAALSTQGEVPRLLLEKGAKPDLQVAAALGDIALGEKLLSEDPSGLAPRGDQQRTPLHWAADRGQRAMAEWLLAKGADVNARDARGRTPLWWAVARQRPETADLLKARGGIE